jgi:FMN-dependent NADH-azoreductase
MAVADAFVDSYRTKNPNDEVVEVDIFGKELIPFDGLAVQAKYTILHGKDHTDEELAAWKNVEAVISEFTSADKYVFAVPMWNFGIPYRLKQYFDILVQPGYTFSYTPEEGYKGMVTGKPVFTVYARGGEYPEGTDYAAYDFQKKYFETIMGFMGFADFKSVVVEPTLQGGAEVAANKKEAAIGQAREIAEKF